MPIHRTAPTVLVLATAALTGLTGCGAIGGPAAPAGGSVAAGLSSGPTDSALGDADTDTGSDAADPGTDEGSDQGSDGSDGSGSGSSTKKPHTPKPAPTHSPTPSGPRISFKVVQKPKCEEGTAVFRAKAVPLIIKWKIVNADSGALSVDDPTDTPGTYSQVGLEGTEEFGFSCAGAVGTVETHTYVIYSVGGGEQKHKKLTVSAKVLDKGLGTN